MGQQGPDTLDFCFVHPPYKEKKIKVCFLSCTTPPIQRL